MTCTRMFSKHMGPRSSGECTKTDRRYRRSPSLLKADSFASLLHMRPLPTVLAFQDMLSRCRSVEADIDVTYNQTHAGAAAEWNTPIRPTSNIADGDIGRIIARRGGQ